MRQQACKKTETMENNKNGKPKKKISKKAVIGYSAVCLAGVSLSIVGGVLVGRNVFKRDNYAGVDINAAEVDYNEVYQRFKTSNPNNYFEDYSHVELINISLLKLNDIDSFYSVSEGSVEAAGVKQTIHGTTIKDGSAYFEEAMSASSFVKSANRFYQEGDAAQWYKGKYVDINSGDYSNAKITNYTIDEFDETWGKSLTRACIYIVSNKSCLSSEMKSNDDGTYTIDVDLDPTLSVLRYIKQMTMTAGLSEPPVFHSVKLKFVVDKEVNLLSFTTDEVYDVHMVIDAKNSKASLTQKFKYEQRDVPEISMAANYQY